MTAGDAFARAAGVVARSQGWPPEQVLAPRGWSAKRARRLAIYLAHVGYSQGVRPLARATGLTHAAISRAVRETEDQRDDPRLDRQLDRMTRKLGRRS